MKTELLSPAGDLDAAYSAFYFGADAVYLGLRKFSARAEATNFSPEELDEITAYAHANGKKVYVTLNTLIQESELSSVMDVLSTCQKCRVDALIVQDLGVARLVQTCFPDLALHGSTQMAIHNLAGALALKKMGFSRVVLARELTLPEILEIRDKSGLEVEVFIHGALCYSYSGLCLFSSLTTGRSANRGKCVYSCRDLFRTQTRQGRLFSMKDLALEKDALKLNGLSLKIEGRKKTALYVGAVTDYYRRILDTGKVDGSLTDNLKQIFARPWTKLHFSGHAKTVTDPDFAGHRGLPIGTVERVFNHTVSFKTAKPVARYDGIQIDTANQDKPFGFSVESITVGGKKVFEASAGQHITLTLPPHHPFIRSGEKVYLASSTRVKGAYHFTKPRPGSYRNRQPLDIDVFISADKITAVCGSFAAEQTGPFSLAKNPGKTTDAVQKAFNKTGDTDFSLNNLTLHNPDSLFVPVSVLNDLRRDLYASVSVEQTTPPLPATPHLKHTKVSPRWIFKTDDKNLLTSLPPADEFIYVLSVHDTVSDIERIATSALRLALPTILRPEKPWRTLIEKLVSAGFKRFEIGNPAGFSLLPKGLDVSLDNTVSILNTQSLEFALSQGVTRITFSVEDTSDNILHLAEQSHQTALVLYQDIPLFLSANCIRENDCASCNHRPFTQELTNGKGRYLLFSKDCQTTVIDSRPFVLPTSAQNIPVGAFRIDFVNRAYTPEQAKNIIDSIKRKTKLPAGYSGNFEKQFAT